MGTGERLHLRGSSPQVRPEGSSRPNVRSTRRSHILKGREKAREPLRFAVGAARADGVLTRNRATPVPYRRCVFDFEVGRTRNALGRDMRQTLQVASDLAVRPRPPDSSTPNRASLGLGDGSRRGRWRLV